MSEDNSNHAVQQQPAVQVEPIVLTIDERVRQYNAAITSNTVDQLRERCYMAYINPGKQNKAQLIKQLTEFTRGVLVYRRDLDRRAEEEAKRSQADKDAEAARQAAARRNKNGKGEKDGDDADQEQDGADKEPPKKKRRKNRV